MSHAEVTLPSTTASVPTARRFVESVLLSWGLDDVSWDATMIVSELTSNVALHAGCLAFTVRVASRVDGSVRIEVSDGSMRLPQQRSHSSTSTTGRGLRIIDDLAEEWGVAADAGGKTVWVELRAGGSTTRKEPDEERDLDALLTGLEATEDDPPGAASDRTDNTTRPAPLLRAA